MERLLKPDKLDVDPSSPSAALEWKHWRATFENFLAALPPDTVNAKALLINHLSPRTFPIVAEADTYEAAMETLRQTFEKPVHEVHARHRLATRKQLPGETLDDFVRALKLLSTECNFKAVSASQYQEELVRDAFVSGLLSQTIRLRLLESKACDLASLLDLARVLDSAQKSSETFVLSAPTDTAAASTAVDDRQLPDSDGDREEPCVAIATKKPRCFFCGRCKHERSVCPAREAFCRKCDKKGHFAKVCRSARAAQSSARSFDRTGSTSSFALTHAKRSRPTKPARLSSCSNVLSSLAKAVVTVSLNGREVSCLIDSGSSESFVHPRIVKALGLKTCPIKASVKMASAAFTVATQGHTTVTLLVEGRLYENVRLVVLPSLCVDVILGQDFQRLHESLTLRYGGELPPLTICGLAALEVSPPRLFAHLSADCHPVATRSRRFSQEDMAFIRKEVQRLLDEGIIEPSNSPWRAQVLVSKDKKRKSRLVIDYSQTINRYTLLDGYPLPKLDALVHSLAKYRYFSSIDLRSAYHQVPLDPRDKPFTAFEAAGGLYQFTRVPFGVTNGVACFQRIIDSFIKEEHLEGTFAYLDDIIIGGSTKADHDRNLENFLRAARKRRFTLNEHKSTFSTRKLRILGYEIENGEIRPDPSRLQPLRDLPVPTDKKSLQRALGLFAYYSQWIFNFSDKVQPLVRASSFPLSPDAKNAFELLKKDIEESAVKAIDESLPFEVETDASETALAAVLNQLGRPVAFFSRTLQPHEKRYAAVEKEAQAVIEAVRHWQHYLIGKHFTIKTDQRSVSFMFDKQHKSKIKNDKILRWRTELSCLDFDIVHRPGRDNVAPDVFTRASCGMLSYDRGQLKLLHENLCHPGVTRLYHLVRSKNLPYSLDEVRQVTSGCRVCAECKPAFYNPQRAALIKATQPFERLNLDFKGPLPGEAANRFLRCVVDEYSRFPFAFPCPDTSSASVIKALTKLFSVFGVPAYVHTDRGTAFMSRELREFLIGKGVACSRTTAYNPQGNGQAERYVGIIWKAVTLALRSRRMPASAWPTVLPDALHSLRSLLCTATNATPHERMFRFSRRCFLGTSLPAWLSHPGPALLKKHVRPNKTDPLVEEVELLEANPQYAHVRFPDGRESTVSLRHLAPPGSPRVEEEDPSHSDHVLPPSEATEADPPSPQQPSPGDDSPIGIPPACTPESMPLRRSERIRRAPDRLDL